MVRPWKIDKNLLDKFQKCACGCGEDIRYFSSNHTPIRFKKYHMPQLQRGPNHPNWKGGRYLDKYVFVNRWDHHSADSKGYVREHRLVWEEYHKASLLPWGIVHHINGIKTDNRIENLQGMTICQHATHHKSRAEITKRICAICHGKTYTVQRKWKVVEYWRFLGDAVVCKKCYERRR